MKKILAMALAGLMLAVAFMAGFTSPAVADEPGTSADNHIVVTDPKDVPEGAVQDEVSTYITDAKCDVESSWVHTSPGVDEVSHQEYRFKRDVPAVAEVSHLEYGVETRFRDLVPGKHHDAVTHQEYKYKKVTPAVDEVSHKEYKYKRTVDVFKTEYQWEKHVKGNKFSKDKKGNWKPDGTFDYRDYPANGPVWSDGGSGPHNSSWVEGNVKYTSTYFKYVKTGVTREVKTGTKVETTDWVLTKPAGDGWTQTDVRKIVDSAAVPEKVEYSGWVTEARSAPWILVDEKTVVDSEAYTEPDTFTAWIDWILLESGLLEVPNLPANTDLLEFRATEPVKVVDVIAVEGYTEYYNGKTPAPREKDKAVWVKYTPSGGWTQFEERKVVDKEAVKPVTTYYAYTDGAVCPPTETTPPTEPTPPVETTEPPTEPTEPPTAMIPPVSETAPPEPKPTPSEPTEPPTKGVLANTGGSATLGGVATAIILIAMGSAVLIQRKRKA